MSHVRSPAPRTPGEVAPAHGPVVVGVLGASGGLGASTLAAAVAVRGAALGAKTVLIDGDPCGGGLDIVMGVDSSPGLRWSDLMAASGSMDGQALMEALPRSTGCAVLSWGRVPGSSMQDSVGTCTALRAAVDLCVLDLPEPGAGEHTAWRDMCDHVVLVCGSGVRQMAGAAVVLEVLEQADLRPQTPTVLGWLRTHHRAGVDRDTASSLLGLPLLGTLEHDRRVGLALQRGDPPGMATGSVARAAAQTLLALGLGQRVAA